MLDERVGPDSPNGAPPVASFEHLFADQESEVEVPISYSNTRPVCDPFKLGSKGLLPRSCNGI